VTFGLKWLVYGVLISIVNLRSLGVLVLGLVAVAAPLPVSVALWSVAFSFTVAFAFVFVFQVSQIVGPRTLGHLGFGRYHQPHLEDRFFLFVDIRGSTTLA
jgi:adenylate cyclase